jgi:hypothetical protein
MEIIDHEFFSSHRERFIQNKKHFQNMMGIN